jgi:hypothetical protein
MATLDDINILDRVKTDPQLLLQAGRQPTVERVKPTFNPASDYFYNNVLNDSGRRMVDFASSEVNNSFNFAAGAGMIGKANKVRTGIAGIGHNQGPPMFDKGIASVMSDAVARKIFTVDEEMDVLYDLNQRKRRLENKNLMDDNLTDQQRDLLYKEEEALNKAISRVQEKAQEKIKKRFATNVQGRTIPELDPRRIAQIAWEWTTVHSCWL